jgi:hypothetical protein
MVNGPLKTECPKTSKQSHDLQRLPAQSARRKCAHRMASLTIPRVTDRRQDQTSIVERRKRTGTEYRCRHRRPDIAFRPSDDGVGELAPVIPDRLLPDL